MLWSASIIFYLKKKQNNKSFVPEAGRALNHRKKCLQRGLGETDIIQRNHVAHTTCKLQFDKHRKCKRTNPSTNIVIPQPGLTNIK